MTQPTTENATSKVERYLLRLSVAMGNLPAVERDENLREIRAHILDSVDAQAGSNEQAVDAVLARLGPPEVLASSFARESAFKQASRSFSPLVWLSATARWALSGVVGFASFVVAMVGYTTGGVFVLAAVLKPLFPHYFGFFVSESSFTLNRQGIPGEYEILSPYFEPIVLCVGGVLILGTTQLLKFMWRRLGKARCYLRGIHDEPVTS